jgi:hypothetical protein
MAAGGEAQVGGGAQVGDGVKTAAAIQASDESRPGWKTLFSTTMWLAAFALLVPFAGIAWIWLYAFHTAGSHWSYVGVGTLSAMAAMLTGVFVGFILGVPKLISSGQTKVPDGTPSPNTNLGDISDWVTKLLLGAGLVSLSHLGVPLGRLIDNVASGLYAATSPADAAGAKVLAGAILVSFTVLGVLEGYVVTSIWYPRKLERLAASAAELAAKTQEAQAAQAAAAGG